MNDFYKDAIETLETLVKVLNGDHRRIRPRRHDTYAKHKYKMNDIDCCYCTKKGNAECANDLCPCVMGSLSELMIDVKFREAVMNADNCKTPLKNTFKHLRKEAKKYGYDIFYEDKVSCEYKPECKDCNYASHGFICYSENNGSCLNDWIRSIHHAGSKQRTDRTSQRD